MLKEEIVLRFWRTAVLYLWIWLGTKCYLDGLWFKRSSSAEFFTICDALKTFQNWFSDGMSSILHLASVYLRWFIYLSFYEDVLDKAIENQIVSSYNFKKRFLRLLSSEFLEGRCLYWFFVVHLIWSSGRTSQKQY